MFANVFITLGLAVSAFATVFITEPTGSTTWQAGSQVTISWKDDGTAPTLQTWGASMVSIYTGNAQQQALLQLIVPSVNVASTGTIIFTPNPQIGPDADEYFIRFQSLTAKDPSTPTLPALAFSAKFAMTGMTGTFNASVQSEINGQSTAPIVSPTSAGVNGGAAASGAAPGAASSTITQVVTTASNLETAGPSSSTASTSSQASGARQLSASVFAAVVGVAVALVHHAL